MKIINDCMASRATSGLFILILSIILVFTAKDYFSEKYEIVEKALYESGDDPILLHSNHNDGDTWISIRLFFEINDTNGYQNLFQTASFNNGIRAELSESGLYLIAADSSASNGYKAFKLIDNLESLNKYKLSLTARSGQFVDVWVDGRNVLTYNSPTIVFNSSDIKVGQGFDQSRIFKGKISDVKIEKKTRGHWRARYTLLLLIILIFVMVRKYKISQKVMGDIKRINNTRRLFYAAILSGVLFGLFYYIYYIVRHGFLPAPFVCNKSNTFMDLFNPIYSMIKGEEYTLAKSIYPPINFLILSVFNFLGNFSGLDPTSAYELRGGSVNTIIIYFAFGVLGVILCFRLSYWRNFIPLEKVFIATSFLLSSPFLFAIERGNLVVLAILPLSIFISTKKNIAKAFCLGLLINIKPYFAILSLVFTKKDYKFISYACLFCVAIFLFCASSIGVDSFLFFKNIAGLVKSKSAIDYKDSLALNINFEGFAYVLNTPEILTKLSTFYPAYVSNVARIFFLLVSYLSISYALFATFLRKSVINDYEIIAMALVILTNISSTFGGYVLIFYLTLIPIFAEMRFSRYYLASIALLFMPLDMLNLVILATSEEYSYLSKTFCIVDCSLGFGSIFRPLVNASLMLVIATEFLSRGGKKVASSTTL